MVNLLLVSLKIDLACLECLCERRNVFNDQWCIFTEPDQKIFDRCSPTALCDQNVQSDLVLFWFNKSTGQFWWKNWNLSRIHFFLSLIIRFQMLIFAFCMPEGKISAITSHRVKLLKHVLLPTLITFFLWSLQMFSTLLHRTFEEIVLKSFKTSHFCATRNKKNVVWC